MNRSLGRTRNFRERIDVERKTLARANQVSQRLECSPLLGLTEAAISAWMRSLSNVLTDSEKLSEIEFTVRELARGTGLLLDESRCAVSEGKVSADFPQLLATFEGALDGAVAGSG